MCSLTMQPHLSTDETEPLAGSQGGVMWRSRRKELEWQYEDLLKEYGPGLSRLAASYEFLAHVREDLLQDIRLALWTALPGFRGECSLRTFVYRIAHNRGLTHVYRRRRQLLESEESDEVIDPKSNPESSAIQNAMQARLAQAIRSLPVALSPGYYHVIGGPSTCGNCSRSWNQRKQCCGAPQQSACTSSRKIGRTKVTSDSEMETWRDAWKAPEGTSAQPRILDMRREVRRKEFRLRALHLLEFASALVLLAFSYLVVQRYPSTEMVLWAVVIWILTLLAAGYSFWNWRLLWTAERRSAREYAQIYEKYCVAGLRHIRFGFGLLAVNLAIAIPWISWKFFRPGHRSFRHCYLHDQPWADCRINHWVPVLVFQVATQPAART